MLRAALVLTALTGSAGLFVVSDPPRPVPASHNDNTLPAGRLESGILRLNLEMAPAAWHPLGLDHAPVEALAFAESGRAPSMPGPMIRVPVGTVVEVRVTNRHTGALVVHGLSARRVPVPDSLLLAPGESADVRFTADVEGTYFYWAGEPGVAFEDRMYLDSQLHGALIVDPVGTAGPPRDRVFVIGAFVNGRLSNGEPDFDNEFMVINGRPWPHTERLTYDVGDSVRWRVINASAAPHPMHLHGFYYRVESRGDWRRDTTYWQADQRMVVTEKLNPGTTMAMTWSPDRSGGWVFHCHLNWHVIPNPGLGDARLSREAREKQLVEGHPHHDPDNHVEHGMGGLMMGIYVQPAGRVAEAPGLRRTLRLFIQTNRAAGEDQRYGYVLQRGATEPAPDSVQSPGATIVLTRGEPTSLWVINRTDEPTQVHWHGLEIESPFDGVVGVGGMRERPTPAIMPADSFEVRVTPPRSGSYMYHTHLNEIRQMSRGLWGGLLVLDPGQTWDPDRDRLFQIGEGPDFEPVLNGTRKPDSLRLMAGEPYRFRLMNISMGGPALEFWLMRNGAPVLWRPVAKDGHDLPSWQSENRRAKQPVSIGETMDAEVTLREAGEYTLEVRRGNGSLALSQPIRAQAKLPTPEQQIAAAVLPLPEGMRAGATVLGYRKEGELSELRKGTNGMTCLADDPALAPFHVACYHESMEPFMARGRALRAEGITGDQVDTVRFREVDEGRLKMPTDPAALWSLSGPPGSWDPATNEVKGGRPLYVIYIPFATEASTGLPAVPAQGIPWIMFPGTPKAHIMFVPRM
jgi:manganese oxidase